MKKSVIALSVLLSTTTLTARAAERPPQFVAIAFDNCTELERWKELSDFAADMNKDGDKLHFTFFLSGVNFIPEAEKHSYVSPMGRGVSRISFGGSADDVRRRIEFASGLAASGHEIASHAVGHFNGAGWGADTWRGEFRAFADLLSKAAVSRAVGFRAPYLATSPGLYTTLNEFGFRYDTSGNSEPDAWPQKADGIWRFNLARLKLHRSAQRTLSMDYNFFVLQSGAVNDPRRFEFFREQILQTYLDYFRANYTGNRAPLHIGHHFFDYQGGAYKEALKGFARQVCGLPEVRCVTYSKLADYMDGLSVDTLSAFQKGDFPKYDAPKPDLARIGSASN